MRIVESLVLSVLVSIVPTLSIADSLEDAGRMAAFYVVCEGLATEEDVGRAIAMVAEEYDVTVEEAASIVSLAGAAFAAERKGLENEMCAGRVRGSKR